MPLLKLTVFESFFSAVPIIAFNGEFSFVLANKLD